METLVETIKGLVIETLDLEDIGPQDIDAAAPLFGDGLGLDSIDALELGIALQKQYGLKIDADSEETRKNFYSIDTLVEFVKANQS